MSNTNDIPSSPLRQPHSGPTAESPTIPATIAGLGERVCRYFLEFLETDFKRQQAPRRKITGRSESGQLTSVGLRKYPSFYRDVWKLARQSVGTGLSITIRRQQHTAPLNPILANLIGQYVRAIEPQPFNDAADAALEQARRGRGTATNAVERYVESVIDALGESLERKVIAPLLAMLESTVKQQAYSALDSAYELETNLVNALMAQVASALPEALNAYLVTGDLAPVETVLRDLLEPQEAKQRLQDCLHDFTTADLYQELRDLFDYQRTQETAQLYLYLCDLRFGHHNYPVLYVPLSFDWDKDANEFRLGLDPHLFVNKRALDYVLQELDRRQERRALSPVEDRIRYLREDATLLDEVARVIDRVQARLDLDRPVDVRNPVLQSGANAAVKLTTATYLAVFDKSDESVLNDYEELLTAIHNNQTEVLSLFQGFVRGVILEDPVQVIREVDDAWDAKPIPDRLVAQSPIPVNEEQRKLLVALGREQCRFLVAYGPPGTGKSHTITAIAFDCILNGNSVLILSDKKEALDVVEDKLTSTLKVVRGEENFQNPILRLGRSGQTYTKLLSQHATDRIRQHFRAAKHHAERVRQEISALEQSLKRDIQQTIDGLSGVNLAEVEALHKAEQILEKRLPGATERLEQPAMRDASRELLALAQAALTSPALTPFARVVLDQCQGAGLAELVQFAKLRAALHALKDLTAARQSLALFQGLSPVHAETLDGFIQEFERLRMPVFGYFLRGRALAALHARFGQELPCKDPRELHRRLGELRTVRQALGRIEETFERLGLPLAVASGVYNELVRGAAAEEDSDAIASALEKAEALLGGQPPVVKVQEFAGLEDLLEVLREAGCYGTHWHTLNRRLESLPEFDAVSARSALQKLHTQRMAECIDGRFLDFVDTAHATAKALGAVIRGKQKFPTDSFDHLRSAFPCIIAGIREFAEYIPLKPATFDVVIIDEASQVSVAQAFPALLRAKKIVVMGDPKQFSNVKSANASNEVNQEWLSDVRAYFEQNISQAADKLQRLAQFDVKKSILEFFELVANYRIMLKKHFRGYQELISFSSKYFYDNGLQAIKVRGKPIDEVIRFTELTWDGRAEPYRNVNSMEMEVIREYLDEHLDEPVSPSVGIVTPFREQQALLTRELFKNKNGQRYEDELRLKIMTFDTCQGEERDIIYYSLVATPQTDRLNYIFPVDLENAGDRVEEALKMQRLNVGFSRAKEGIHFVISKPVEHFRGSIARGLQHYVAVLEAVEPDAEAVDPASPMEAKLLDWLMKTPFVQANRDAIEVTPQFPVGDYLRQLDPYYQHPAYRADFLLQYHTDAGLVNVIIEYDGFHEHFRDHGKLHAGNYERYYRPEDIERQMVLESYGYKFLRVNRFNLGRDPATVLSKRLYDLLSTAQKAVPAGTVEAIREQAKSLADGTSKPCQRCHQIRLLQEFFDAKLKNGAGGYGRVCMACKTPEQRTQRPSRGRSSYRKWRRRYS